MNLPKSFSVAVALVALGVSGTSLKGAQTLDPQAGKKDFDAKTIAKMYDKLMLAIQDPNPNPNAPKTSIVSLRAIGIPIRPGFSEANPGDLELLQQQFDYIPAKSPYYVAGFLKYSDVYGHILNAHSLIKVVALSPAQAKEKKDLETKYDPNGDLYTNYLSAKNDLVTAATNLRQAKNDLIQATAVLTADTKLSPSISSVPAGPDQLSQILALKKQYNDLISSDRDAIKNATANRDTCKAAFTQANDKFTLLKGPEIDGDLERLYDLQTYNGEAWWKTLRDNFKAGQISGTDDSYTLNFFPPPSEWNPAGSDPGNLKAWPDYAVAQLPQAMDAKGKLLPAATAPAAAQAPADGSTAAASTDGSASTSSTSDASSSSSTDSSTASAAPATPVPHTIDPAWVKFTFTSEDVNSSTSSSAEATSVSGGFNVGFYSGSFSHNDSKAVQLATTQVKGLRLTFEMKLVSVFRPWMDLTVFRNNNWTIPALKHIYVQEGPISYGPVDTPKGKPDPLMPTYLNTIVLVRNLSLKGDDLDDMNSAVQTASSNSASASYGPFNMSAAHESASSQTNHKNKKHCTEITCPGVQVIGCVSTVVPACPQPMSK